MTQRAIDGPFVYFVTANVQNRRWFFVTSGRAAELGQAIQTCCRMKNFDLLAYCILPNHVHLLVRKRDLGESNSAQCTLGSSSNLPQRTLERVRCGRGRTARLPQTIFLFPYRRLSSRRSPAGKKRFTLSDLMRSIKGTFSRSLPKGKFWQHRSNFRIVETEAYLSNVVEYILHNYRKMNLDERYGKSPYIFLDWKQFDQ
ncbi:MAG: transposase [Candidatus Kerfeldbacteria bacterium]|nr:transposase [Candidatus Kerfeldbacteria bacterium]